MLIPLNLLKSNLISLDFPPGVPACDIVVVKRFVRNVILLYQTNSPVFKKSTCQGVYQGRRREYCGNCELG